LSRLDIEGPERELHNEFNLEVCILIFLAIQYSMKLEPGIYRKWDFIPFLVLIFGLRQFHLCLLFMIGAEFTKYER